MSDMTREQMIDLAVRRCFCLHRVPLAAALLDPIGVWERATRASLLRRARAEFRRIARPAKGEWVLCAASRVGKGLPRDA